MVAKKLKAIIAAAVLLFVIIFCSACNEFETVNTKITVSCVNNSGANCYIWFTGEEKSNEMLTLPGGSRSRNIILSYTISNVEGADNSALVQEEKIYVYIYKNDGTQLEHDFNVKYEKGKGAAVKITFDGSKFSDEITQN